MLKKYRRLYRLKKSCAGLCYHSISNVLNSEKENIHTNTQSQFIKQIKFFKKHLTFLNIKEFLIEKTKGTKNITTITFDDAYRNISYNAIPFLIEEQIPFTIFVNSSVLYGEILWRDSLRQIISTGLSSLFVKHLSEFGIQLTVDTLYKGTKSPQLNSQLIHELTEDFFTKNNFKRDNSFYLSKEVLVAISRNPLCSIGNHTQNHYVLSSLPKNVQENEIKLGFEKLKNNDLNPIKIFAAPFGGYQTINQDTIDILVGQKYEGLFLTNGNNLVDLSKSPDLKSIRTSNRYLPK